MPCIPSFTEVFMTTAAQVVRDPLNKLGWTGPDVCEMLPINWFIYIFILFYIKISKINHSTQDSSVVPHRSTD